MSADEDAFGLVLNETALVRMFLGECCLLFVYIFLVSHKWIASLLDCFTVRLLESNSPQGGLTMQWSNNAVV